MLTISFTEFIKYFYFSSENFKVSQLLVFICLQIICKMCCHRYQLKNTILKISLGKLQMLVK
jgi:hypothetical protein